MEERHVARGVTQRHLELEPAPPAAPELPLPPVPEPPPKPSPTLPPADAPIPSSNSGLLERQLRWHRERAKFETNRGAAQDSKQS